MQKENDSWNWIIFLVLAFILGLVLAEPLGISGAFWDELRGPG
jgi:hypothetical protein